MAAVRNEQTLEIIVKSLERSGGDMALAADAADASYTFIKRWMRDDPKVDQAIRDAVEAGTSVIESAAIKRATRGVKEPVFHNGEIVGHKRRYSDGLTEFLLKARKPEMYGTRIDVNKTITLKSMNDDELDKRITDLSERLGLTYQPILEAELVEDAEFEPESIELDDLL